MRNNRFSIFRMSILSSFLLLAVYLLYNFLFRRELKVYEDKLSRLPKFVDSEFDAAIERHRMYDKIDTAFNQIAYNDSTDDEVVFIDTAKMIVSNAAIDSTSQEKVDDGYLHNTFVLKFRLIDVIDSSIMRSFPLFYLVRDYGGNNLSDKLYLDYDADYYYYVRIAVGYEYFFSDYPAGRNPNDYYCVFNVYTFNTIPKSDNDTVSLNVYIRSHSKFASLSPTVYSIP